MLDVRELIAWGVLEEVEAEPGAAGSELRGVPGEVEGKEGGGEVCELEWLCWGRGRG